MLVKILLVECCFCYASAGFNFTRTLCVICYLATQIVGIFHILLFLIYNNSCWGWWNWDSYFLGIFHIRFHSVAFSNFSWYINHACNTVSSLVGITRSQFYSTLFFESYFEVSKLFDGCPVRISAGVLIRIIDYFFVFPQNILENIGAVTALSPKLIPSLSFRVYYTLIILQLGYWPSH